MKHIEPNSWHPLTPRTWQNKAWNKWMEANFSGTIEAGTGAGKTYLGMMMHFSFSDKKLLVVVPTIHLMHQWTEEFKNTFKEKFGIDIDVGNVGEGKYEFNKKIVVAVVNSIRDEDLKSFDIVILDEVHRYMSMVNRLFIDRHNFPILMALTATMKRDDGLHKSFLEKYPCVFKITQKECIDAELLCKYNVVNLPCPLLPEEQEKYDTAHGFIRTHWHKYKTMSNVMSSMRRRDYTACNLMKSISKRRQILMNSATKIVYTANLITQKPDMKTIVFGEYKNAAEKLYKILKKHDIPCGIYHSGINMKKRKEMLQRFKDDEIKIIISVKALDEGLNVPSVERAIIMGGSKVERQMAQRLGRVLRGREGKVATVIQLFIPNTKDEEWARARTEPFKDAAEKIVWLKTSVMPDTV